jgi:methyl-accepting chemotaxis protein
MEYRKLKMIDILLATPNNIFIAIIIILTGFELAGKAELKAQIISIGVLGTFVGIFLGLQDFDPNNMKNSIYLILAGLKTAFVTSIFGMIASVLLSIIEKFKKSQRQGYFKSEFEILESLDYKLTSINENLGYLPKLDNTQLVNAINLMIARGNYNGLSQPGNTGNSKEVELTLKRIEDVLISKLEEVNVSIQSATKHLAKGATEEIIDALRNVITDFNSNLESQFGGNFKALNLAVKDLVVWQENYKNHIAQMEDQLETSTSSIEKAKESILLVEKSNSNILELYKSLENISKNYKSQSDELKANMKSFETMIPAINLMFTDMENKFKTLSKAFEELHNSINTTSLAQTQQLGNITQQLETKVTDIAKGVDSAFESLERYRTEIGILTQHFKTFGEEVPQALNVSLSELSSALAKITLQFQKDYEATLYNKSMRG